MRRSTRTDREQQVRVPTWLFLHACGTATVKARREPPNVTERHVATLYDALPLSGKSAFDLVMPCGRTLLPGDVPPPKGGRPTDKAVHPGQHGVTEGASRCRRRRRILPIVTLVAAVLARWCEHAASPQ